MKQFNLETQTWEGQEEPGLNSLAYIQSIYRDSQQPIGVRMPAAIEALPFESPKLTALAVGHWSGQDFATRLDQAIARSRKATPISALPP